MNHPQATLQDCGHIQRCYELAQAAVDVGNHPFAALLVSGPRVVLEAQNSVLTEGDHTRHAELVLLSKAWKLLDRATLGTCTLYSSTEPCLMCAGAIFWAGIPKVVFGVEGRAMNEAIKRPYRGLPLAGIAAAAGWTLQVVGPVMPDDGLAIHKAFWPAVAER